MKMNVMTRVLGIGVLLLFHLNYAYASDEDMDGVEDRVDKCKNTPFLDEVDDQGCTTTSLIFPQEYHSDTLNISFSTGFSHNEDISEREEQSSSKVQLSYYLDAWSYSLQTGYFDSESEKGLEDTTVKIKRKFKLTPNLKISLGASLTLPSYDFVGNQTDYTLYSSLIYYPKSSLSLFGGVNYTFIQDDPTTEALQNTTNFYVGTGYFFTKDFYMNLSYSHSQSKFTTNHDAKALCSTLFYKINDQWFTTLYYSQEIDDEDLHNNFKFKIGYTLW